MQQTHSLKNLRTKRSLPPAHYSLRVDSYSSMSSSTLNVFESRIFKVAGYKWRLLLHPNGDPERDGENHISLYLKLAETNALPDGWEVNAIFTLFVYDQLDDKYMAVQDVTGGGVKRFHAMKTTWGFPQLLPLETFKDPSKGYLVNDSCVFGAEVLVIKHFGNWESVSLPKSTSESIFIKKFEKFSEYQDEKWSESFTFGGKKWKILIYPNGEAQNKYKSLGLYLKPGRGWARNSSTFAKAKLRLCDQIKDNHVENTVENWFSPATGRGSDIISLKELHEPTRGLIVKDCLVVEVKFYVVSEFSRENK